MSPSPALDLLPTSVLASLRRSMVGWEVPVSYPCFVHEGNMEQLLGSLVKAAGP